MYANSKQIKSYGIKNVEDFKTIHVIYKLRFPKFRFESFNIKTFTLYFLIYIRSWDQVLKMFSFWFIFCLEIILRTFHSLRNFRVCYEMYNINVFICSYYLLYLYREGLPTCSSHFLQ